MEKKNLKKYFFEKKSKNFFFKIFFQIFFSMTKKYFFSKFYFSKRSSCVLSIPLLFIPIRPKNHYEKNVRKKRFFRSFCLYRSGSRDHAVTKPIKSIRSIATTCLLFFKKKSAKSVHGARRTVMSKTLGVVGGSPSRLQTPWKIHCQLDEMPRVM